MNSALRSSTGREMTKRMGGQVVSFVRNAGGHSKPPGYSYWGPWPPGPKQMQQLGNWIPGLATFGAAGGAALVYFTDWRVISDYIPFYNGKYKKDD